ncbi:MAG: hydroxyisourate hydrolase [Burkholderiales bacterium]|nr:hydroxyisourate hydrolase [Burkholderiales bacterium]MCE7875964.1 hydroxyisourate hydrolase [Betaproteobacteria bacterium PRO3]
MAKLSTHVLDTWQGRPAAGVRVDLYALEAAGPRLIVTTRTNADGRTDAPLLQGDAVKRGRYRLVFHLGEHYRSIGVTLADPPFLDVVPIEFGIADERGGYHVPLVCTPFAYSTYRGS